jgi:LysM repeat protein
MKKLLLALLTLTLIPSVLFAYTIQPGDTLSKLASRFNTTVEDLARINNIQNPNLIYAGDTLVTDDLLGAAILPEDGYDTFLTSPLSSSGSEVFVNVLPQFVTSSIYTIFASDGRTVREKIYCTSKSASPNKLTGCVRGISEGPVDGVIDETAGTGVSHSRNARIAITDNTNFSGKALAILGGNQPTGATDFYVGTTTVNSIHLSTGSENQISGLAPIQTQSDEAVSKAFLDSIVFTTSTSNKVVVDAVAGETVAENDIVYFDETDKEWKLASATFVNQANYLVGLAMGAGTNGNAIDGGVMTEGIKTGFVGLTAGEPYYMSDTSGEITDTPGTIFFELGYAQSATQLYFFPKFKSYITKNQKDALAGTEGTPSASNEFVTDADTSATATASSVVRRDANGDAIVPTTPTASAAATSKTYVDTNNVKRLATINTVTVAATTAETTVMTATVPGGVLGTNGVITGKLFVTNLDINVTQTLTVRLKYGSTTLVSQTVSTDGSNETGQIGTIEFSLVASGSTSAQRGLLHQRIGQPGSDISDLYDMSNRMTTGTATENSTGNLTFSITVQPSSATTLSVTFGSSYATIMGG